ncbi:MAG: hypothetical protein ABW005_00150 [Burkholderiaceae bacterium]
MTIRSPRFFPLLLLMLAGAASAQAAAPAGEAVERSELARRRSAIEAQYARDSQACQSHFAVNECLTEVRQRRNAQLKPVQDRLLVLGDQGRRTRAKNKQERVEERQREAATQDGAHEVRALTSAPPLASPLGAPRQPKAAPEAHAEKLQVQLRKQTRDAQRNREQLAERRDQQQLLQRSAQEREDQRKAKTEQSLKDGKKVAPVALPLPSAAEIAAVPAKAPPLLASSPR